MRGPLKESLIVEQALKGVVATLYILTSTYLFSCKTIITHLSLSFFLGFHLDLLFITIVEFASISEPVWVSNLSPLNQIRDFPQPRLKPII